MNTYLLLKAVHAGCAVLSGAGFLVRWLMVLAGLPGARSRVARILPHVVDTVLLASAIALAWIAGAVPLRDDWLTVKVGGLLVYIALGMMALGRARSTAGRALAGVLALAVFGHIVATAVTKSPMGLLSRLLA